MVTSVKNFLNFGAFTYAMLVSIRDDMAMTWCLCGDLCGIDVKLMLGNWMLVTLNLGWNLDFIIFFVMLNNLTKKGHNPMLTSTSYKRWGD